VFCSKKLLFKESSFRHLRQCFLTMPEVNKHLDAGARRAGIERALVGQRSPEGHHEAAGQVQGNPDEGFGLCDSLTVTAAISSRMWPFVELL
jgi:hypothetical protein